MAKRGRIRKIADEAGVDQATVRRAFKQVGVSPDQVGIAKAVETVTSIADPARIIGHAVNGGGDGERSATTDALAEAKAHAARLQARKLELQNAKLEGSLIPREAVTATGIRIIAEVRTALLALHYRLADKVAGKTDVQEIARITESEVRVVLGELADEARFFSTLENEALS